MINEFVPICKLLLGNPATIAREKGPFEDNSEIILADYRYNCLNFLFANVDKLNIKQ